PVVFEDELLGVIVVLKLGLNQYNLDQLRLLTILANQAAVSIANARLIDRLASAATIDPLTGLMNRAAFEEAINKQLLRPQSWGTLLMLDVDNLRETNDAYGHRAGDAVLKRIGRAIRTSIRSDDLGSRWIGDNFAILAPGIDAAQAELLAKRIETAVQSDRISRPASSGRCLARDAWKLGLGLVVIALLTARGAGQTYTQPHSLATNVTPTTVPCGAIKLDATSTDTATWTAVSSPYGTGSPYILPSNDPNLPTTDPTHPNCLKPDPSTPANSLPDDIRIAPATRLVIDGS